MKEHHARALEKAKARLLEQNPDLLAIILGGSIAKGTEREDSDVDLMVVVPESQYKERVEKRNLSFLWMDVSDYGSYVEGRFISLDFIREAAKRGSEPTRHSYTGTYTVYCIEPEVDELLPKIPVYPEDTHQAKMDSFVAQLEVNQGFFWGEAVRMKNLYLQAQAATKMVQFGSRLILAHNKQLFACQKRLIEQALAAPKKPENLETLMNDLFTTMSIEAKEAYYKAIKDLINWGEVDCLGCFLKDIEMSWYHGTHDVGEW